MLPKIIYNKILQILFTNIIKKFINKSLNSLIMNIIYK